METIKKMGSTLTSNVVGGIAGGAIAYWAINKHTSVSSTWKIVGAITGVVLGAMAEKTIKAKMSTPKATLTAKK